MTRKDFGSDVREHVGRAASLSCSTVITEFSWIDSESPFSTAADRIVIPGRR
jgi:hypothetical protein